MLYIDGRPVHTTIFPDNTSQVWKLDPWPTDRQVTITWDFSHEGEFLQLAQLSDLLFFNGIGARLAINYLPYGRQDKKITNESTFALHTFAHLLNGMNWVAITINDPHSPVATQLIRRSTAIYPTEQLRRVMETCKAPLICYPDKGALEKYRNIYPYHYMYADKIRDPLTGDLKGCTLHGTVQNKDVLIVDDICDGGATFINLTRELYKAHAGTVSLFVTHGIFSKGVAPLFDAGIDRIFTHKQEITRRSQSRFQ